MDGVIQPDDTVRGGTGWGAEFAKLCNEPLFVFDQERDRWCRWTGSSWETMTGASAPVITHPHFTDTATRTLRDNARRESDRLFERSFTR